MIYKLEPTTLVYYINLKDNTDRNDNMIDQTDSLGFSNVKRVEAYDTRTQNKIDTYKKYIDPNEYAKLLENNKKKKRNFHEELTNGAIGCFLSHLSIYKEMVDNNIPLALILEDDFGSLKNKNEFWKDVNSLSIPNDTDVLLYDASVYGKLQIKDKLAICHRFYGMHFYLVTNSGAHKLLKYLLPIRYQIDSELSILNAHNLIKLYIYDGHKLAKQNSSVYGSEIRHLNCSGPCGIKNLFDEKVRGYDINGVNNDMVEHFDGIQNYSDSLTFESFAVFIIIIIILFGPYFQMRSSVKLFIIIAMFISLMLF